MNETTMIRIKKMKEEIERSNILNEPLNIYSYDGYNNKINKTDVVGTVVPQNSRWGITNGWKIVEVNMGNLRIRKLTPKECFNLQGFPKDFQLPKISSAQLYKQAGNSVCVTVIERIAKKIFDLLNNL